MRPANSRPARKAVYDFLRDRGAQSDLTNAARAPDAERVRELLSNHATEKAFFESGLLAHASVVAADAGNSEVVSLFLSLAPPSPDALARGLERAFLANHWPVIDQLMPLVPKENLNGYLCGVCEFLNLQGLEALLRFGASADAILNSETDRRPLDIALSTYSRKAWRGRFIETLIEHGAKTEDTPEMAIHRGRADLLSQHLRRDSALARRRFPDMEFPGKQDLRGGTLLHLAAEVYELECAQVLLEHGADLDARSPVSEGLGGHSPVFQVVAPYSEAAQPAENLLEFFLQRGANLDVEATLKCSWRGCRDPEGPRTVTPLGWARWHSGSDETVPIRLLRLAGALE